MTREEAKDLLDNLIGMVEDNHDSDYDTALQMAIQALEQKYILKSDGTIERIKNYDVLGKIRAEIIELATYDNVDTLVDVIKIIDKYAGGEGNNE